MLKARVLRNHRSPPLSPSFLSRRRLHRRPLLLAAFPCGLRLASHCLSHHTGISTHCSPSEQSPQPKERHDGRSGQWGAGQGPKDKAGHGAGHGPWRERPAFGERGREKSKAGLPQGGTWDEFPFAGYPVARAGSYRSSLLCPLQLLEATPQCPGPSPHVWHQVLSHSQSSRGDAS